MQEKEHVWHREVVSEAVQRTLDQLDRASVLGSFYLAGGTGLALHLGHRRSVDLDFFTSEPFDPDTILNKVQRRTALVVIGKGSETLHAHIAGVKVSFLGSPYPLLFPAKLLGGVTISDARDIGCMKISAIAGRGTKRDFVDLYAVSQDCGLRQLLEWSKQKFHRASYSVVHILKSLTYFEEAEQDPMPDMLIPLSWDDVKRFFLSEVPRFL